MSFKTTYILFGILAAELAGLGLMLVFGGKGGDLGYVFPSWHAGRMSPDPALISTVEIDRPGEGKLVFVREGQTWYRKKPRMRLETYPINVLIREILRARWEEGTDVTSDKKAWGLEPPRLVVTLRQGADRAWTLNVGKESPEKNGVVYVSSSDRPDDVLAVRKTDLAGVVSFNFDNLWSRKLLDANPFITRSLTIADTRRKGNDTFTLQQNGAGGFDFTVPPYGPAALEPGQFLAGGKPRPSPGVRGLLGAIDRIQAVALEPFNAHPLDWYGLQDGARGLRVGVENYPPTAQGRPDLRGTVTSTLLVGHKVDKQEQYYVRLLAEEVVYRVEAKGLATVREVAEDRGERLRSQKLTQVPPFTADAIVLRNAQGPIDLRRTGQGWLLNSPSTGVQKADYLKIHELLVALNADNQVKKFLDNATDAAIGVTNSSPAISVWVNSLKPPPARGPNPPAPRFPEMIKEAVGKPTVKLEFGTTAGDLVNVKREERGFVNRLAVPKHFLGDADQGPLAFLTRNLTPFVTGEVDKLVLKRRGETLELTREKGGTRWRLQTKAGPQTADAKEVEDLLLSLTQLEVARWVKFKPSAEDLKVYGLNDPSLRAAVTFQRRGTGKPQTRVYSFGKEKKLANGQPGVYGRLTGANVGFETDLIFLVPVKTIAALEEAELRERRIFKIDPIQVNRLTLQGWYDPQKPTIRLRLELVRAGDQAWKVAPGPGTAPEGFQLDDRKVEPFLRTLTDLKFHRFVRGGPQKDYKLGRDNCTLLVEMRLGDKQSAWLIVGAQKKDEPYYYAQSSTLGKEVFLLPKQPLDPLLATPPWTSFFQQVP